MFSPRTRRRAPGGKSDGFLGGFGRRCGLGRLHHFSAALIQIRRDGLRFATIFRLIATFRPIRAFLPILWLPILWLIAALLILLMLHRSLVHGVQDAEVMLRMLKIAFRHNAIPTAGRIAPKLEVFFEKLLRRAAQPQIRPVRVKYVVTVKRLAATLAATPATMTELAAPTMTVTAPAAHALHVHLYCVSLFRIRHFRDAAGQGPEIRPKFRVCCIQTVPKEPGNHP